MNDDVYDFSKVSVRRSMVLLGLGAVIGLGFAGYGLFTAQSTRVGGVPPEAVALVNGRPVLRSDFMAQAQTQYSAPFDTLTREQRIATLDDMLAEELRVQRGLEIDLPSYDPNVRAALVSGVEQEVASDTLAKQPTDAELRKHYADHVDKYSSEGRLRLRDLVITASAGATDAAGAEAVGRARAAREALQKGAALDVVAQRFGLADSGAFVANGVPDTGDILEFAVRAKLAPPLLAALEPLDGGGVGEPVVVDGRVHVLVVQSRVRSVPQPFEAVANQVWNDYKLAAQERVNRGNLDYLRGRAEILLAPDYAAHAPGAGAR